MSDIKYKGYSKSILSLFILFIILPSTYSQDQPIVQTKLGIIIGTPMTFLGCTVHAYLGVPYATAPTGELRFKRTVPVEPWPNPIFATSLPPACPQFSIKPYPWFVNDTYCDEDCLYLNIWVPSCRHKNSNNRKAVMYWMHGGGFTWGSSKQELYDGRALASAGDVIVVTINYRLGPLGFIYSGSEDAPGNMGLYDMLEGLRWVKNNIAAFGGDENSITLFGESSGAVSAGLFMLSPMTEGLFQRVILHSESPLIVLQGTPTKNALFTQILAEAVNCANGSFTIQDHPAEVVDCMRGVDAMKLVQKAVLTVPKVEVKFTPQYGDNLVPYEPTMQVLSGRFRDVEILMGNNANEGSCLITMSNNDIYGSFGEKHPLVNKTLGSMILGNSLTGFPDSDVGVEYYLGDLGEYDYDDITQRIFLGFGEYFLVCPEVFFAEKYAEKCNPVNYYLFLHRPSTTPWAEELGVTHYEEIQFVFGRPYLKPYDYKISERELSRRMMKIWSDFAKGIVDPTWPVYRRKEPISKLLNIKGASPEYGLHRTNCNFYRPYYGFD